MSVVSLNGRTYEADVFVFDKDGLLFQSKPFWQTLARVRAEELEAALDDQAIEEWFRLMGVTGRRDNGRWRIDDIDTNGMLAVASPDEEMVATAAFINYRCKTSWVEARTAAREVYANTDERFPLNEALAPHKGFPEIFRRLREHHIPYGIATSDNHDRAVRSVNMYDEAGKLSFILTPKEVKRGKPDAEMLEKVSAIMNVPAARLIMVGDSVVDVQMAKAAGSIGVGVPEHEDVRLAMGPLATEIVSSLDDIVISA